MKNRQFIEQLRHEILYNPPGESAHISMAPMNRPLSSVAIQNVDEYRISAVAILLYTKEFSKDIHCVLIQRPNYEGAHSGQISFPGGKLDLVDLSAEHTARRECYEEIGFLLNEDELVGKLTDVFIPVSNFLVHPYLYYHSGEILFKPDEREVSEIITFPIGYLKETESQSTMDIFLQNNIKMKNVPCFVFENKKIWGATALILNELKELLIRLS